MESLKKQAAKLLGEQKKYRRWLTIFLCLAIVVTMGTLAALKMNGQALSHKQKVLKCGLELHEHTEECYESDPVSGEKTLICGYADYVVHTHNDDCYNADGELVCQLEEAEAHIHEESCYEEQQILVCELEESEGHQHTESCKALTCGKTEGEGHQHTESCRALVCEKEEGEGHKHTESCKALVCEKTEGEGHQHTDACRTMSRGDLICENTEEGHEHTDECYEQVETITCGLEETEGHTHTEACYDSHGCGLEETEAHTHTEECYDSHACKLEETEGHTHTEACYDPHACKLEESGHTHTEECYKTVKVPICGKLELHTHITAEEAGEGEESCYDEEGKLICKIPELKEHVHGEDCFEVVELTKEEVEAMKNASAESEENGTEASGGDDDDKIASSGAAEDDAAETGSVESGETGSADGTAGNASTDGNVTEDKTSQKIYDDGHIRVVAEYDSSAGIPEEAELYVEKTNGDATFSSGAANGDATSSSGTVDGDKTTVPVGTQGGSAPNENAGAESTESGAENPAGTNQSGDTAVNGSKETVKPEETESGDKTGVSQGEEQPGAESSSDTANADENSSDSEGQKAAETLPDAGTPEAEEESGAESSEAAETAPDETVPEADEVGTEGSGTASDAGAPQAKAESGALGKVVPVSETKVPETTAASESSQTADTESGTNGGTSEEQNQTEAEAEEQTYRIGFRQDGKEILPKGTVTFTVWNLDEEESEPETIVYSAGEDLASLMVTLQKKAKETEPGEYRRVYEDETIRVIAEYGREANIPEEAELVVKQITPESDPDNYALREEEFKKQIGNEDAAMNVLLSIGFYIDNEENETEEIEPQDTVTITIQFLDKEGIALGAPIDIIHFAEDGTEVLDASDVDQDGSTTFKTDSFSDFGFLTDEKDESSTSALIPTDLTIAAYSAQNGGPIPIYTRNESNEWEEAEFFDLTSLGDLFKGQIEKEEKNYYYIISPVFQGETEVLGKSFYTITDICDLVDGQYVLKKDNARWIAYSTDGGNTITTAKLEVVNTKYLGEQRAWVFEGEVEINQITGIYYLPENTTLYKDTPLNDVVFGNVTGNKVFLNPGNGNGDNAEYQVQYGYIKRTELELVDGPDENGIATVLLPTNSGLTADQRPQGYSFQLVGWYNIADQTYYNVENVSDGTNAIEAKVNVNEKNVFYADWKASGYNFRQGSGEEEPNAISTTDTNDFIKTRVFDFNGLFNVYSSTYEVMNEGQPTERESWKLAECISFGTWVNAGEGNDLGRKLQLTPSDINPLVFIGPEGTREGIGGTGILVKPIGWNGSNGNYSQGQLAQGNWNNLSSVVNNLFSSNGDTLGVHYIGEGNFLYYYDAETGEYVYDSDKNAASYQESEGRFYVYNTPQYINTDGTSSSAFLPFNTNATLNEDSKDINYHFGMSSEINFYLPDETEEENSKDMVFKFTGDDDVWVFVDGELVLDMGGIHKKMGGEINFTEKTVSTYNYDAGYQVETSNKSFEIKKTPYNEHKLTIYYMERGAGKSNCKISFNIVPRYKYEAAKADTVQVEKKWENTENFSDITMELYDKATNESLDTVTLNEEFGWSYTWEGLTPGVNYGVREIEPEGYQVKTENHTTGSYDYWVMSALEAGEVIILDKDGTKALSHDLKAVSVIVQNGVISPRELPDDVKWGAEKQGDGYRFRTVGKDGDPIRYLVLDREQKALRMTSSQSEATVFVWNDSKGFGLCDNDMRIVYRDDGFEVSKCSISEGDDLFHVNLYMLKNVASKVSHYTITNTFLPNITISKIDSETNKTLPAELGAEFRLARVSGDSSDSDVDSKESEGVLHYEYYNGSTWVTDETATFQIDKNKVLENLADGEYILTEVKNPEGYKMPEDPEVHFKVQGAKITEITHGTEIAEITGNELTLQVKNEPIIPASVKVKFLKVSNDMTSNSPLAAAEFTLYRVAGEKETAQATDIPGTEEKGVIVKTGESGEDGTFFAMEGIDLVCGTYYLMETEAPDGYHRLEDLIKFTITEMKQGNAGQEELISVKVESDGSIAGVDKEDGKKDELRIITVKNFSSMILPETGSLGTKPFTIGGAMLITATAILMYGYSMRRRKSERRLKK